MGKATRVKQRTAEQEARRREQEAQLRRLRRPRRIIITIVCVLLGLAIAAGCTLMGIDIYQKESGEILRSLNAVTANSFAVNNATANYYFRSIYSELVDSYGDSVGTIGLSTTQPLREQICAFDSSVSWFDYLLQQTEQQLERFSSLYAAALEAGVTLSEQERANIDNRMQLLEGVAADNSMSVDAYVASIYGRGMRASDLRECLEFSSLAEKYSAEYSTELEINEEEIDSQFKSDEGGYRLCEYKFYSIWVEGTTDADEENRRVAKIFAKGDADAFEGLTSEEEFDTALKNYLVKTNSQNGVYDITAAELNEQVEATRYANATYDSEDEFLRWAYSEGTDNTSKVIETDNSFLIYFLIKAPQRPEYVTKNVRHILFSTNTYGSDEAAKAAAEQQLEQIRAQSDKRAAFIDCAARYSTDNTSFINGGLYENVKQGDMVQSFNDWCYDEARQAGDIELISSDYGYNIMYFEGDGDIAWRALVKADIKTAAITQQRESAAEKQSVTLSREVLNRLPIE